MAHRYPDRPLFYRRLDRAYPCATAAEGCWIVDEEGKRYLDASGGAAVANLGHDLAAIADEVAAAIRGLGYVNGTQFANRWAEELAEELLPRLPPPLAHPYFLTSGSEAVEAAVKLARQVWVERGRPEKWKVIGRVPSYHGNTLAALSLSGREHYRRIYAPLLTAFPRIPAPDSYRRPADPGTTGEALETEILRQGPETVAAFILEPIGGATAGATVPSQAYIERVSQACRRHQVLLIADEVLTGLGRTGRWFACEHFGLGPDIMTLGKGLTGGALPLSAVVASREIAADLARGSGGFNHAQTYSHTPAICAAGLATVRHLAGSGLVQRCATMEDAFLTALSTLRRHAIVGDVRGKGLLAGIELVADRSTREPFPRAERRAERLAETAFAAGLVVWPNAGHADGERGDLILLAPPFTIDEEEILIMTAILDRALEEVA